MNNDGCDADGQQIKAQNSEKVQCECKIAQQDEREYDRVVFGDGCTEESAEGRLIRFITDISFWLRMPGMPSVFQGSFSCRADILISSLATGAKVSSKSIPSTWV